jgi:hypothetical protein
MARQEGLEPPTPGLEGPCSIQLNYCRIPITVEKAFYRIRILPWLWKRQHPDRFISGKTHTRANGAMLKCTDSCTHPSFYATRQIRVFIHHSLVSNYSDALLAAVALPVYAGVTYQLDRPSAAPGETVTINAVFQ